MSHPPSFTAEVLRASARGFAALVAERLVDQGRSSLSFDEWRTSLEAWIQELDAAVRDDEPRSFVRHIDWARRALIARNADDGVLREALVLLDAVLSSELPDSARARLRAPVDAALKSLDEELAELPSMLAADDPAGQLAALYVLAVLEGRRRDAQGLVLDAVRDGEFDIAAVYADVLAPAQSELGRMWHLAEASIAEEHLVTATTTALMGMLMAQASCRGENGKVAVCASVGSDLHDVGVRMVADLLELDGWRVIFLGSNVPSDELVRAIADFDADLLVVSATLGVQRRDVTTTIEKVRDDLAQREATCAILAGGAAYASADDLWSKAGADGTAISAREAVVVSRRLVGLDA